MSKVYKVIMTVEVDVHDCKNKDEAVYEARHMVNANERFIDWEIEVEEWKE
tara:strand:- start:529 stop:681 length:153 start_codon:yes stop_codon:yes gene_type:complete